jgi:hypothetical protein
LWILWSSRSIVKHCNKSTNFNNFFMFSKQRTKIFLVFGMHEYYWIWKFLNVCVWENHLNLIFPHFNSFHFKKKYWSQISQLIQNKNQQSEKSNYFYLFLGHSRFPVQWQNVKTFKVKYHNNYYRIGLSIICLINLTC